MNFPTINDPTFYSALSAKQEGFAGAHIRAICSSLGCGVAKPEPDDDKLDFTISSKVRGKVVNKPKIDVQSKCRLVHSPLPSEQKDFSYQVDLELYDSLRDVKVASPRLLVVTLVPYNCDTWIKYSNETTSLSFCSYWISLRGMPSLPEGRQSKTIRIPRANIFSATFLHKAMQGTADGQDSFEAMVPTDE